MKGGSQLLKTWIPNRHTLEKIRPVLYGKGPTERIRKLNLIRKQRLVRLVRQKQQEEGGLVEWPFGLFGVEDGVAVKGKTIHCTEAQAKERNRVIKEIGFVWRRIGY